MPCGNVSANKQLDKLFWKADQLELNGAVRDCHMLLGFSESQESVSVTYNKSEAKKPQCFSNNITHSRGKIEMWKSINTAEGLA